VLPREVVEALKRLLSRNEFTGHNDLVFCNSKGGPLNERSMDRKFRAAAKEAGVLLPKGAGWHCIRRYFATQSDRDWMPDNDRRRTMGHAAATRTEHYTEADLERRRPYVEAIIKKLLA